MHKSFVKYFIDMETGEPLELIIKKEIGDFIETGCLKSSQNQFPIIKGIPRFIRGKDNYSQSFGYQWKKWGKVQLESENIDKPMQGHTSKMFNTITDNIITSIRKDDLIIDIGCGSGRFIDVIKMKHNNRIIGIDYSNSVETAHKNFKYDANVCIIQADALNLPFQSDTFNGSFSIGVLHHTPNPAAGVKEAYRILKKGSWFAISVYSKKSYYDKSIIKYYRKIFNFLMPLFSYYPAILYSYIAIYFLRPISKNIRLFRPIIMKLFPFVDLPDKKWSILDTFDSVTPSYASTHESNEVHDWLNKNGFINIVGTDWGSTSFLAKKPD